MGITVAPAAQIKILQNIATELGVQPKQVSAAVALLDEGATVPFIARYRKEATGNLDDTQLRTLEDLYLPYKPRRRTRAQVAREVELEPLADALLASLRTRLQREGILTSVVIKGRETAEEEKFRDYYAYDLSQAAGK